MNFYDTSDLKSDEIHLILEKYTEPIPSLNRVPAYFFAICLPDGTKIGECTLRAGSNQNTYWSGNIGYRIDEEYRGHHYAGKACFLLFELAKKHGMDELIITCDPINVASRKTCEYIGCTLETIADLPKDHVKYDANKRTQSCIYRISLI